jgi:hypothetical protein
MPSGKLQNLGMVFAAATIISFVETAVAADYSHTMQTEVKKTLGNDFRDYSWLSYPTTNFGIATMYVLPTKTTKASDKNQWCASFTCLGMDDDQVPSEPEKRLKLNGFADIGSGGPITLTDTQKHDLAIGAVLPKIGQILGLNASTDWNTGTTISLSLGNVNKRFLIREKLYNYIHVYPWFTSWF